jgi:DNA-binding transcriptional MerR regulator
MPLIKNYISKKGRPIMTSQTIQDTLTKYDIHLQQLLDWEESLDIRIPTDLQGNKLYTRQHLNLFKNIKKHMALGRSLAHIKQIITLPPAQDAQPVERNVNQAWGHIPSLQKIKTPPTPLSVPTATETLEPSVPNTVTNPLPQATENKVTSLSLESEALLQSFKESADAVIQPHEATALVSPNTDEADIPFEIDALHETDSSVAGSDSVPDVINTPSETSFNEVQATEKPLIETITISPLPEIDPVEDLPKESFSQEVSSTTQAPEEATLQTPSKWSYTPAIMSPQALVDSFKDHPTLDTVQSDFTVPRSSIVEKRSTEFSPTQYLSAPLAVLQEKQEHSLQIVDRLLTEKDALQNRLIEAEKLNSHLYNVNSLFNKKVTELTTLIKKMKHTNNENELMKLMDDKAKLQRQLLDADKDKLDAQRQAEKAKDAEVSARADQQHLAEELKAQRQGFAGSRFLGNWRESLKLREIQYDTFGLNVEEQRSQHRLIDVLPARVVGNVAFVTTRYAYPDNSLWQRLETLTLVYLEDNHAQGELQVDYILDGIPVCRAIYLAQLERIS